MFYDDCFSDFFTPALKGEIRKATDSLLGFGGKTVDFPPLS